MSKKSKSKKHSAKRGALEQIAALPYRQGIDGIEILVITSRRTKRLIIPKGWRMPGISDAQAAAIEAEEEAGVKGRISDHSLGRFDYVKDIGSKGVRVTTEVFPLQVRKLKSSWKERKQRKRKWLTLAQAIVELDDVGLKTLIKRQSAEIGSGP